VDKKTRIKLQHEFPSATTAVAWYAQIVAPRIYKQSVCECLFSLWNVFNAALFWLLTSDVDSPAALDVPEAN